MPVIIGEIRLIETHNASLISRIPAHVYTCMYSIRYTHTCGLLRGHIYIYIYTQTHWNTHSIYIYIYIYIYKYYYIVYILLILYIAFSISKMQRDKRKMMIIN